METLIHPMLVSALGDLRERMNAQFQQAKRGAPQLDGPGFLKVVREQLNPLAIAFAERAQPLSAADFRAVILSAYEVLLTLASKGLIGPRARLPQLESHWSAAMQAVLPRLQSGHAELLAAYTNALVHLETTPGVRVGEWVILLERLAAVRVELSYLKAVGQVAAWRCGMAMLRPGALALAKNLPVAALAILFGLPETDPARIGREVQQLLLNPWHDPAMVSATIAKPEADLEIVGELGAFRGFGGMFRQPPLVSTNAGLIHVTDCESTWVLMADAFGAVFTRLEGELPDDFSASVYALKRDGTVVGPHRKRKFPLFAGASSHCSTETTLAVTLPHSHHVFLVTERSP
ncbi:hypothetical protein [Tuwongella immobilis]|uniref:Uncharacterized protein n=1 Tax=Tuwongella immobilis TaxID=692036 RepID=A0A6C2YL07_9BACT|nr:hypothetical protein [Tuwongella immobilis]VIP01602.1 Uncharacterized protein OS=Thiorhodovibrio sp. 970 GN=Thi970DRAFT_03969 PE=4 SV=1 [Tuwongella immobilis]VTR98895.1 Uncharacterized protein OS=Thiorhodovibrio sp. 970 GN=Thi970DRAFT_03969 PE=4 SV=1 [Tuwongella immobilis]